MAKKTNLAKEVMAHEKHKKVTSIGRHATRSIPKNKRKDVHSRDIEARVNDLMSL